MFLRRLAISLLLLSFGAASLAAQSRRAVFSIGGFIRDESGQHAMESIEVSLKQATGTPITTTFTRGNGEFQFGGLENGDYIVDVSVQDFEPARETVTISGASRMGISMFLHKSVKALPPSVTGTISAHQLSVPHRAHDEFEKGMTLIYLKSDYRGALVEFQHAIRDFPSYYEAYAEAGSAHYQLQELAPAEEALRKSIELSSGQYADASFTLAGLLTDTKRFAEAESVARKGIASDSSSWRGPLELARALTALKRPEEAEKSAIQSRDLMPDNPAVYLLLANVHIQEKNYPALMRDLDDYLRLAPTGPEADQARKTRERVQGLLEPANDETSPDGEDDPQSAAGEARPGTRKEASPRIDPDPSGLPSLPPPSAGNP